ncbi:MAG: SpoIIE family protein phosphatase, partial [Gemmatimonadetes bacterium]|nr:SpoIIE family protein phosphatase [Gemmatimonadota bacterium]
PEPQLSLSSAQEFVLFAFQGSSLTTAPDQMAYVYRLANHEEEWRTTRETQVEYRDLPMGSYTFEVKAVDRDLNYSEQPATVSVDVHAPYGQIALLGGLGVALAGLVLVSLYAVGKRRDQRRAERALIQELEEELQTAHEMQMSLMPAESPHLENFDIVGRCLPANHVGGDFFQYHPLLDGKLALSLADVTGHAMEAAVPVIMFSGILHSQMELGDPPDRLFGRLNRTLFETLDNRTFVCFTMGELEPLTGIFRFANAGCPYPYHYRASTGEVEELAADAYPLGINADSIYSMREVSLSPGDRVVFCSDGIAEATNEREEMFGFEQTAETIKQGCVEGLSAEMLIDRLIDAAKSFAGAAPQGDDMTAVVLRVKV